MLIYTSLGRISTWTVSFWFSRCQLASGAGLTVWLRPPLAVFLAIYSEMGSTEECCLFRRPACLCVPAATLADWQVVKMSLCTNQKVGTQGRQSFALELLWSHSGIRASKCDITASETHTGSRDKNRACPSIYINIPTNYTSFNYCESTHLFSNLDLHLIKLSSTLSLYLQRIISPPRTSCYDYHHYSVCTKSWNVLCFFTPLPLPPHWENKVLLELCIFFFISAWYY